MVEFSDVSYWIVWVSQAEHHPDVVQPSSRQEEKPFRVRKLIPFFGGD
jgi:hypothetical protein